MVGLVGLLSAVVIVLVGRGQVAAAWGFLAVAGLGLGAFVYNRSWVRASSDARQMQRLRAEMDTQQLAVEKALQQLDALRAKLKESEAQVAADRRFEQRAIELQSQAALGRIAGGVAHSFNNMLVGIVGYASAAEESNHLSPSEMRHYLEQINGASQRASELCFQLMVAAGRRATDEDVVYLRRFRTEIAPLLEACVVRGATFTIELAPQLPRVRADLGGLQVALCNLVFNALDAIAGRGGHLTLAVTAERVESEQIASMPEMSNLSPGEHVKFVLEDDGSGIADDVRERVFEPGFTTKRGRMGLGLTAVSRWVRRRQGCIGIKSAAPHGARVELYLPAIVGTDAPDDNTRPPMEKAALAAQARSAPSGAGEASRRVLLIDDDQTVRDLGSMLIQQIGLTVVTAEDGHLAEKAMREEGPFGLALVDYSMPGRDGVATIKVLREINPELKVVLISGALLSEIENLEEAGELAGLLQKPFNYSAMKELLIRLTGGAPEAD